MADNLAITAGSGTTIAADDVGPGVLYQRVKISVGADGSATDMTAGSGAIAAGTPRVTLATDSPGVTAVGQTTAAASLPVVQASDYVPLGGYSVFRSLDLDETEEDIKVTAGQLYKLRITNFATTARYVKLYNATAADTTVGSTAPFDTITVPPAAAAGNPTVLTESYGPAGVAFATALCAAATTALADADTGAPAANDVVVTAFYK